jgi:hypothetical protein
VIWQPDEASVTSFGCSAAWDWRRATKLIEDALHKTEKAPDFIDWLNEAIELSKEDVRDNCRDINSYGSGYDMGRRDALEAVLSYLNGDDDV